MRDGPAGPRPTTRWVDRSLRAKGLVVIAVPIGILVVVLATTIWFTHVDNRAQNVAGHARQIVDDATTVENSVFNAQTGIDAYLLTGSATIRDAYTSAAASIPGQLRDLSATAGQTSAENETVAAIGRDVSRMTFDMAELALEPPSPAPSGSVRAALLRFSQAETSRLRHDVAALSSTEGAVIASQRSAIHTSGDLLPIIAIAAVVLAVAGGVVVSQLFTSGVVTRLRRLERATAALERGEVPEVVPTGRDEIGRLSAHLIESATQVRVRATERDRARRELEDILTASPVVSLCYDVAAWRFSYASPNIERLLGISAERAMADPGAVMVRFHPDTAHELRDVIVAGAGRSGARFGVLARFRRDPRSDDWGEADAVYSVECGPGGEPLSVIAYLVDVSERHVAQRAAEERRFLLESIFHASPDTIVVRDTAGRVLLASSPLTSAGTSNGAAHDAVDQAFELGDVADDERAAIARVIARCLAGEHRPEPVVTTGNLPDGQARTKETRARPVLDQSGRVRGTVTVSRDITERVRLEQSLRGASSAALRASEAKSEFLSRMSHELRTPLNAILGFAQLLELDELPPDQASSVDQIQVAGRHLLALINEVLDISRIEAGRLTLSTESVDVSDVLDEVATLLTPVAESAALALSVDSAGARALYVQADRQRLLQVLLNLGSNAVKYNNRGGSVSFQTRAGDDGLVRFDVHDTGPGIAYEQQDKLFLPFSRLGAERSAVEGTGVGLALSKQLVEVMGGTIGVESTPGRGSTFWVELRRAEPKLGELEPDGAAGAAVASEAADAAEADGRRRPPARAQWAASIRADGTRAGGTRADGTRDGSEGVARHEVGATPVVVLHIEDNPSNASLVEQMLAKRPAVRLVSAAEGRSGLELARQHRPDLVLLDLHLPDLGGDELLHRLKAVPELADTKVVVVSADATPSRIRSMLDLGVEGYLTKPVDVEALLRLVDHEIGERQRERR